MVLRETKVEGLIDTTYYPKSRRHHRSFNITISSLVKDNLKKNYGRQIADNDNTLKHLRDSVDAIENQFRAYITNYGLTYNPYNCPFTSLRDILNDEQVGETLSRKKYDSLILIATTAKNAMEGIAAKIESIIDEEAKRLNSKEPYQSKSTRIRLLQEFAEKKLQELITLRENLKKDIQNEYTKFQAERVAKSYEEHGPTPIL